MSRVYVFLAAGFEEIEALTVADMLRREKIDTSLVSVTGDLCVTGSHGITVTADSLFENISYEEGEMLVLPGGMPGTRNLQGHEGLRKLILSFAKQKKYLAAVCAAPVILGGNGLLNDRHATCYPGYEEELKGAVVLSDEVVVDGSFITSRGMGTTIPFAAVLVRLLKSEEDADALLKKIMYLK